MANPHANELKTAAIQLQGLGDALHLQRKKLKVSATAAAEAAGLSRVTWHRMEKGEPSVSAGAYAAALSVLGLRIDVAVTGQNVHSAASSKEVLPLIIPLQQYPQLKLNDCGMVRSRHKIPQFRCFCYA